MNNGTINKIKSMAYDINVAEIKGHETDESLSMWVTAWQKEMLRLIKQLQEEMEKVNNTAAK